ncbi:hypothetical protein ACHAP3_000848 [Botrytis cinerea]
MVKWPGSQEPDHTGFAIANNIENTLFSELGKHPFRAKRFSNAMAMVNREVGFESSHIVDAFTWWDSIRTFVDVGGSLGEVSITLANSFPRLHCTSQDLQVVVDQASISVPQDISNRVTFMVHDFFTEHPVMGADVYLFRCVFHNHSDKYCIEIPQRLIPALKPGARIVIAEYIVPPPGSVSKYKSMDLAMAELLNAKERDLDEWKILLKNADENFDFIGMEQPKDSKLYFIEARWNLSKLKSLSLLEAS